MDVGHGPIRTGDLPDHGDDLVERQVLRPRNVDRRAAQVDPQWQGPLPASLKSPDVGMNVHWYDVGWSTSRITP